MTLFRLSTLCLWTASLAAWPLTASAQINPSAFLARPDGIAGARLFPSRLDLDDARVQLHLLDIYGWAGGNLVARNRIKDMLADGNASDVRVSDMVFDAPEKGRIGAGLDFRPFAIAVRLTPDDMDNDVVLSYGWTWRSQFAAQIGRDALLLGWKGNKQFAGRTADVGKDLAFNAALWREMCFGVAAQAVAGEAFGLRAGLAVKYLRGGGIVRLDRHEATMYTAEDGSYIDTDFDYSVQTAGLSPYETSPWFAPASPRGQGVAFDFGVTAEIGERMTASVAVTDLGFLRWKNDLAVYARSGTHHFDGLVTGWVFGDERLAIDSIPSIYAPDTLRGEPFSTPTSARFLAQFEYRLPNGSGKVEHGFHLIYVQGLSNTPGSLVVPYVNLSYRLDVNRRFQLGVPFGLAGFDNFTFGLWIGAASKRDTFRFMMGWNGFVAAVSPSFGVGGDLSFSMTANIGGKSRRR